MLNIVAVGAGIIIFLYSITFYRRIYKASRTNVNNLWWSVLVVFILFFMLGYLFFMYYLLTNREFFDLKMLISQVFLWGSVFVLICTRLFYLIVEEKNKLIERIKNEDKLRAQNEFIKLVIDSFTNPFYVINVKDHTIAMANAAASVMGDGATCYAVSHKKTSPCGSEEHPCPLEEVKIRKKPIIVDHIHYDRDGNPRNIEVHCYPIFDNVGNVVQVIEYSVDITERKRAEQELILARDEALRASAVKSDFLAKMSHELRTPLNAVMGFSEILRMKGAGELNEKQERYVDNIYVSGKHLLGIISDILDMVKLESGEKLHLSIELFPVSKVIDEILIYVTEKASKKNIDIKKYIEPGFDTISADKLRFKQILLVLLENAIKFSKQQGGTVTIAAEKAGDMAQFSVTDTGIGIREQDMGKLFDLFHQLDSGLGRKYGGIGLGLAITKQLVEQHGGRIWVESKYGEGTTFTFMLPLKLN